jgi:hypothetical protein
VLERFVQRLELWPEGRVHERFRDPPSRSCVAAPRSGRDGCRIAGGAREETPGPRVGQREAVFPGRVGGLEGVQLGLNCRRAASAADRSPAVASPSTAPIRRSFSSSRSLSLTGPSTPRGPEGGAPGLEKTLPARFVTEAILAMGRGTASACRGVDWRGGRRLGREATPRERTQYESRRIL